jgi:Uma2 family endonuclease
MDNMPARVVLTYRDYEALPADGRRYELHEGELLVTAAPGLPHQRLVGDLFVPLWQHVQAYGLGEVFVSPVDCILSDTTVVQPDVVYLAAAQLSLASARGIEGAPTLAVEIVSPSTARIDRGAKLQLYARHGVPYYWIVDPDARRIEAYVLSEGVLRVTARMVGAGRGSLPPLPDLTIDGSSLWRGAS